MSVRAKSNSSQPDNPEGPSHPIGAPATMTPFLSATSLLGFNALDVSIRNWRTLIDSTRNLMRLQQDAMLEMMRGQLMAGKSDTNSGQNQLSESFHTAAQMYERMGSAWLDAQQSALDSLTHSDVRH